MADSRTLRITAVLVGLALLFVGYQRYASHREDGVRSPIGSEIMVMRTRGGLLEVSTLRTVEVLDRRITYSILGIDVGETVPRIRVPAWYRYRIELAPEWQVRREGNVFTVVAPAERPALPVAVDLSRMEKETSGTWILLPFTSTAALDELERSITDELAKKAVSPAYRQMQRETARATVSEFVGKWLLDQPQWRAAEGSRVVVRFADEGAPQ
jgi:hypothetical protein